MWITGPSSTATKATDPPSSLLHGFLCDSRVWQPQLRGLSDGYRVVAWDAAGAGASDDPPEAFAIADWVEDLRRLLDELALEAAHVVGLSWGGLVAQAFYGRYASRVRSLVLSDTYAGWLGSLPADAVEKRLARCLSESELDPAEFVARWVPTEFFTDAVSEEVTSTMADIVTGFHPLGFRLMARSLAENDRRRSYRRSGYRRFSSGVSRTNAVPSRSPSGSATPSPTRTSGSSLGLDT